MINQQIRLVDMEERLAGDRTGAYRDEICNRLNNELADVKRAIDAGLAPAEFEAAETVRDALLAAVAVVQKLWQVQHQKK